VTRGFKNSAYLLRSSSDIKCHGTDLIWPHHQ
jgi:cysteinyl-tRNA synthetase